MKIWFGFWVVGIILSVIILATNPKRDDVGEKVQRYRTLAIVMGFVPCFGFSTLAQIIYIVMYRTKLAMAVSTHSKLGASLSTDFGSSPGRTAAPPAASPGAPPAARPPSSDNPFL